MAELKHSCLCLCYYIRLCQEKCLSVLISSIIRSLAWLALSPKSAVLSSVAGMGLGPFPTGCLDVSVLTWKSKRF